VTSDGTPGVYSLSLDSGRSTVATIGRRAFGLPFHRARMRMTRHGRTVTFRSRHRTGGLGEDAASEPGDGNGDRAVFQAQYPPGRGAVPSGPGSFEAFRVERVRCYLPARGDSRVAPLRAFGPGAPGDGGGVYVGRIERGPWTLRPVAATVRRNGRSTPPGYRPRRTSPSSSTAPASGWASESIGAGPAGSRGTDVRS